MTVESFRATIYFGLLYIVLVALAATAWRRDYALLMICATAGMAYLTQCLVTMALSHADYGMGNATAVAAAAGLLKVARILWAVTIVMGAAAGVLLMVAS